jgi:hypothetical protein
MEQKSNTLVIHPKDLTTDCLEVIYKDRDWDVIRDPDISPEEVWEAIEKHSRIIMLGHGTPYGLLAGHYSRGGYFTRFDHFIINQTHTELLRKKDTFSIWCNSDLFFKRCDIPGLHTGMIISEEDEEYVILGKAPLDEEEMAKNMELFCGAFAKYIDLAPEECAKKVLEEYVGKDAVTQYNRKNITVL